MGINEAYIVNVKVEDEEEDEELDSVRGRLPEAKRRAKELKEEGKDVIIRWIDDPAYIEKQLEEAIKDEDMSKFLEVEEDFNQQPTISL